MLSLIAPGRGKKKGWAREKEEETNYRGVTKLNSTTIFQGKF